MRKLFFGALALLATVGFVGCVEPNPTPSNEQKVESIEVRPSELTLVEGEEVRLSVVLTPSDITTATVTWSSSNEAVAIVDTKGAVTALSIGEAEIVASAGEGVSATCHVTVKSYLNTLKFTQATYLMNGIDTNAFTNPKDPSTYIIDLTLSNGATYKGYKALVEIDLFSEGYYVNGSGELDGTAKAANITFDAPLFYAPNTLNPTGTIFVLGEWFVTSMEIDPDTLPYQVGLAGKINKAAYITAMKSYVENWNKYVNSKTEAEAQANAMAYSQALSAAGDAVSQATLNVWEYHSTEEGYPSNGYYGSYIPAGLVSYVNTYLGEGDGVSQFMIPLDYLEAHVHPLKHSDDYFYGCHIVQDTTTWECTMVDEDIYFDETIVYETGIVPSATGEVRLAKPLPLGNEPRQLKTPNKEIFNNKHFLRKMK